MDIFQLPIDQLLLKRKGLRRQLSAAEGLQPVRIAVLGGSTTNEVVDLLELYLLASGFQPTFHQSEYGRYYEDAVVDPAALVGFAPDIVYVHTSVRNLQHLPPVSATAAELQRHVDLEFARYQRIWTVLKEKLSAQIIQNNFELPPYALLGNYDVVAAGGATRFVQELNAAFARAAESDPRLILQDVHTLSARIGLEQWFDHERYFSYKVHVTPEGSVALARSLTSLVRAIYGKTRKVLVLDLDNTLWGGVIGDEGADKIQIGRETPIGEAYTAFQEYCLSLQRRGVLLAVCSKNNEEIAKQGFEHPDSVLRLSDFSCFKANWEPKHENILAIARELNVGVDSFVFVDDNPAERAIVEAQVPEVAVPNVGAGISHFAEVVDRGRYFEAITISAEDLARATLYHSNAQRTKAESRFATYGEYLHSLEMVAEIGRFRPVYMDRIAQLINKTNQFNLTTKRYTLSELETIASDPNYIGIYGRLSDRFGDNGLISIVLGRREGTVLHLDLWLMSCRVLKRDMELAMLDAIVDEAKAVGVRTLLGVYIPTKKNGMVADHYEKLSFIKLGSEEDRITRWSLALDDYKKRNTHISIQQVNAIP